MAFVPSRPSAEVWVRLRPKTKDGWRVMMEKDGALEVAQVSVARCARILEAWYFKPPLARGSAGKDILESTGMERLSPSVNMSDAS